jgi:hypothetical protein
MPVFEVRRGDKTYEVDAPDMQSASNSLNTHLGPQMGTGEDVAKSAGSGVLEGMAGLAGLPGDVRSFVAKGIEKATGDDLPTIPGWVKAAVPLLKTSEDYLKPLDKAGMVHAPQTTAGEYAHTAGQFLPAIVGGPESLGARAVRNVLLPALASETAGRLPGVKGSALEPYARGVGAVAGALSPTVLRRAITPFTIAPERQALVDALQAHGVQPTAGQATGSRTLQAAEEELGGGAFEHRLEGQKNQYTSAALHDVGINEPRGTTPVINHAFERIGGQFDALEGRNTLVADHPLMRDLHRIQTEYDAAVLPNMQKPIVRNTIAQLSRMSPAQGAQMPGTSYQPIRSMLRRVARGNSVPEHKEALNNLATALDNAMERSMRATGNHADLAAWRQARTQYRNLLTVAHAVSGPGEDAAMGVVSPAQLRIADAATSGRRAYARGRSNFSDLAHAGQILTSKPNSWTARRGWVRAVPAAAGAAIGAALGHGMEGFSLGALAGASAPPIVGRALMSRPVQSYLVNQLMAGGMTAAQATQRAALIEAMQAPRQIEGASSQ